MRARPVSLAAVLALKGALLGLALFVLAAPGHGGLALTGRALAYPLVLAAVPIGWLAAGRLRERRPGYPYLVDGLVTTPFLVDLAAAVLALREEVEWWGFAAHALNWALLVVVFGLLMLPRRLGRLETAALVVGFGAVAAILWELVEYPTLHRTELERAAEYRGTLADLAAALAGSALGALALVTLLRPGPRR